MTFKPRCLDKPVVWDVTQHPLQRHTGRQINAVAAASVTIATPLKFSVVGVIRRISLFKGDLHAEWTTVQNDKAGRDLKICAVTHGGINNRWLYSNRWCHTGKRVVYAFRLHFSCAEQVPRGRHD